MSSNVTISRNGGVCQGKQRLLLLMTVVIVALCLLGPGSLLVTRSEAATITNCAGCHGYTNAIGTMSDSAARNNPNGQFPGSHGTHVSTYGIVCADCHVVPATETTADNDHANMTVELKNPIHSNAGASYKGGTYTWARTNSPAFSTCTMTYCHSDGTSVATGTITTNVSPLWGTIATGCATCHGIGGPADGRPNYASGSPKMNDHQAATHLSKTCDVCHDSVTYSGGVYTPLTSTHNNGTYNIKSSMGYTFNAGGGSCATSGCHGNAQWGVTVFNCVTCHSASINITAGPLASTGNQRRDISNEFLSTWSHARSMRITTITQIPVSLCIACHMEGDNATGGPMASYHGNGYVELRDPDTGVTIQNVVWVSAAGNGGGWYTSTGTPLNTMARFTRNLGTSTLEGWVQAVQFNMCLHCHDGNGALSTLARVGTTNRASVAALRPFNVTITALNTTAAMSSMGNATNGSGNIVNVKQSLLTTNSSYHPVLGRGGNSFIEGGMLLPPWNGVTTKTMGTLTNSWGNLISCWDCHADPTYVWTSGAGGTAGGSTFMTFTNTAHGGPAILRGGSGQTLWIGTTAAGSLCVNCHRTAYSTSSAAHPIGGTFGTSAFSQGNSNMGASTFVNCGNCHSYYGPEGSARWTSAAGQGYLDRPLRAENVHGFNDRTANVAGSTFSGSLNRPFAFLRNGLTAFRPKSAPGITTGTTGTCTGSGGTCNNNMSGATYSPGGAY